MAKRSRKCLKTAVLCVAVFLSLVVSAEEMEEDWLDYGEYDYERWYVGASVALVLPQGSGRMQRRAGANARLGYYVGDFLAVEASAAWLECDAGLGIHGLWHWWGYEKFEPFFTFGANGWIEGEVGPSVGWGCFWHFNDLFSARFDADATLGLDGDAEMVYQLGFGFQYSF